MRKALKLILDLSGVIALGYGAWLAWPPAGFMVGGAAALLTSLAIDRAAERPLPESSS